MQKCISIKKETSQKAYLKLDKKFAEAVIENLQFKTKELILHSSHNSQI